MAEHLAKYFGKIRGGMCAIGPGLFVGCLRDANNIGQLTDNKISHVLSVLSPNAPNTSFTSYRCYRPMLPTHQSRLIGLIAECAQHISHVLSVLSPNAPNTCVSTCQRLGLTHKTISMADSMNSDLLAVMTEVNDFIQQGRFDGSGCLVHCFLGSSRSVAVVCAYLMTLSGWPADRCMQLIERRRPTANPNFGFRMQLKKWETKGADESVRFHALYDDRMSLEAELDWMNQSLTRFIPLSYSREEDAKPPLQQQPQQQQKHPEQQQQQLGTKSTQKSTAKTTSTEFMSRELSDLEDFSSKFPRLIDTDSSKKTSKLVPVAGVDEIQLAFVDE